MKQQPIHPMSNDVHEQVQKQFGAVANAYTNSAGHGDPSLLRRVIELAEPRPTDRVLDIATGAGHTAITLAPYVAGVVAYDLTPAMLEETARNAAARGLQNIITCEGAAEQLQFHDSSFDIVTVRHAPHHYADIRAAIREMARVVKPHGRVVIIDSYASELDDLDRDLNHIEKVRDSSHVRSWRPSEWRAMVREAGLTILAEHLDFYMENGRPMDFDAWTTRMKTPPDAVQKLRRLFRRASPALVDALKIVIDGERISFCVPQIAIKATKA